MKTEKMQIPELSDETAAQILHNVFTACQIPENETPFQELKQRYEMHKERYEAIHKAAASAEVLFQEEAIE